MQSVRDKHDLEESPPRSMMDRGGGMSREPARLDREVFHSARLLEFCTK
jgi:hypothetical protein